LQGGKVLSDSVNRRLLQAIESRLLAVSTFISGIVFFMPSYHADIYLAVEASDENEINVLEQIQAELEGIASLESELSSSRCTIADLITRIDKVHP
jgi:hypothetical protein